jgi:hypothetical protein
VAVVKAIVVTPLDAADDAACHAALSVQMTICAEAIPAHTKNSSNRI